ncbi:solute carrier family 66 member 2-like isoform X2 [Dreissena polymorpha]|uniref:solute carrier family 66 member 2-like isoform X2 n=1 Tax=Dreissena polymorpha TaxID=45954 RepID=UPI002265459A|nr:solute carrier family 66 member 2-like isoform X2 [Dreissena polymorpha]
MVNINDPVKQVYNAADEVKAMVSLSLAEMVMEELTFANIAGFIASGAMIFGGVFPFIPQYRDIRRTQNADGFSLFVCLTLLIANILRILFWFGKRFELPLLAQSVIMTFTMLALVHLCVTVKHKGELIKSRQHHFTDFDLDHFWQWSEFGSYVQFTVAFSALMGVLTFILISNWVFIETIGFLAVFAEAMLGAPQFYRNFQNKSTQGMSKKMVGMWTCGDVFKTCYFVIREAPAQFWICGSLQVMIDISIFLQVFAYRKSHRAVS